MFAALTHDQLLGYAILLPICLAGLWVWWRYQFSPAARAENATPRLRYWAIPTYAFLMAAVRVVGICYGGMIAGQMIVKKNWPHLDPSGGTGLIVSGIIFQISALIGIGVAAYLLDSPRIRYAPEVGEPENPRDPIAVKHVPLAGLATYAALLPVMLITTGIWPRLVEKIGGKVSAQELVKVFGDSASQLEIFAMGLMAVLVAPIVEETVFRAGIFRFMRRRAPRWAVLLVPAVMFSLLHWNLGAFLPLVLLSIIFALAYERTGRIAVTMIAHGLFNLTTLVFLLAKIEL